MQITKLRVSRYKNLLETEIQPNQLHVITGCNGSGKTNFLETLQFVARLSTEAQDFRRDVLVKGASPSGISWFPMAENIEPGPMEFEIGFEIPINNKLWEGSYELALETPNYESPYQIEGTGRILSEVFRAKEKGKKGPLRILLSRDIKGAVRARSIGAKSSFARFRSRADMSALQALDVREAEMFGDKYPLLFGFRKNLQELTAFKLDANRIYNSLSLNQGSVFKIQSTPGLPVTVIPLIDMVLRIKSDTQNWLEYKNWLEILCGIKDINLFNAPSDNMDLALSDKEGQKAKQEKILLLNMGNQLLFPKELSTGNLMLLALVTAIFSSENDLVPIVIEEPETYLHPKAIVDLLRLLREVSVSRTVLLSSHSPVLLNSLKPDEVSVLIPDEEGLFHAVNVASIDEAMETLNRGYISFGDLMQTNFNLD